MLGNRLLHLVVCVAMSHLLVSLANAQRATQEDEFSAELFYSSHYVENAEGNVDGLPERNEVQNEYGGAVLGRWYTELTEVDLDYNYTHTEYDQNTQQDSNQRTGESHIILGNETTFYHLDLEHSVRRILRSPGAVSSFEQNSEERAITSATPLLRTRVGEANSVAIAYTYADVEYKDSEDNSSERTGIQLQYVRDASDTMDIYLSVGQRDIDFITSDDGDYEQRFVNLRMVVERRLFDYVVQVGRTSIKPNEGGDTEHFSTANFRLFSELVGNSFQLFASRSVSDTSVGNRNDGFFMEDVSFDGGAGDRDQLVRTAAGVGWDYEYLCQRCTIGLDYGIEKARYVTFSDNDTDQTFYELTFGYQVNRRLGTSWNFRSFDTSFSESSLQPESDGQIYRMDWEYSLGDIGRMSVFYEKEERSEETVGNTSVATSGASVSILFD